MPCALYTVDLLLYGSSEPNYYLGGHGEPGHGEDGGDGGEQQPHHEAGDIQARQGYTV